jgi:hypothetical protein
LSLWFVGAGAGRATAEAEAADVTFQLSNFAATKADLEDQIEMLEAANSEAEASIAEFKRAVGRSFDRIALFALNVFGSCVVCFC